MCIAISGYSALLAGPRLLWAVFTFLLMQPTSAADQATRQWATFIHLSLLAGVLLPGAGFILPIVLWQVKKDELPGIDAHGKVVANWLVSALIYGIASSLLMFVLIGFPLLGILALLTLVFPIIGGIKANEGVLWPYPLSIRFFS
jgi:uncharacterized Tic20 family protein